LAIVPGFIKAQPAEVLVHEWPVWKKFTLKESEIPEKFRELMGLVIATNIKCPYCLFFHNTWRRWRELQMMRSPRQRAGRSDIKMEHDDPCPTI
jgi:hypothetical protein